MLRTLERPGKPPLAYVAADGRAPAILFLHGFMSDMEGAKALSLEAWAKARGQASVRFDLTGHGQSGGAFRDGTISSWLGDVLDVVDGLTSGPLLLAGSSMGGWLALLAALARPGRVTGLLLIAPAPDFTQWSLLEAFDAAQRDALERDGQLLRPSAYGPEPYVITRALIDDGARHLLLAGPVDLHVPVRILHGQADPDVPWRLSLDLADRLASADVQLLFIKDGDHRLSRPQDLDLLTATLDQLLKAIP